MVGLNKPLEGSTKLELYQKPPTGLELSVVSESETQTEKSSPQLTTGSGFIMIVTESVVKQFPAPYE